jgi:hypothetical protein
MGYVLSEGQSAVKGSTAQPRIHNWTWVACESKHVNLESTYSAFPFKGAQGSGVAFGSFSVGFFALFETRGQFPKLERYVVEPKQNSA